MKRRSAANGTLAAALAGLAQVGEQSEVAAASVLSLITAQDLRTLKAFDAAVADAYTANGWHAKPGRPSVKTDRRAVPHTVRTYMWEVRAAYRADLPVWTYPTFYALRMALRAKRTPAAAPAPVTDIGTTNVPAVIPPEVAPKFEGVRVMATDKPNGAIWHDLAVCYLGLPPAEQALLERQLSRLLHKYQPVALAKAA
jgi:hypothetical protein